ncbi:hypothetical protein OG21DRAFT_1489571 [Imleria badia]|nr:hypothetical protein OG21DRAFT_1489571 [Imleria badia]
MPPKRKSVYEDDAEHSQAIPANLEKRSRAEEPCSQAGIIYATVLLVANLTILDTFGLEESAIRIWNVCKPLGHLGQNALLILMLRLKDTMLIPWPLAGCSVTTSGPPLQPTIQSSFSFAAPGQQFGFRLPDVGSQHDVDSSSTSSELGSSYKGSVFSAGSHASTAPTSRANSVCSFQGEQDTLWHAHNHSSHLKRLALASQSGVEAPRHISQPDSVQEDTGHSTIPFSPLSSQLQDPLVLPSSHFEEQDDPMSPPPHPMGLHHTESFYYNEDQDRTGEDDHDMPVDEMSPSDDDCFAESILRGENMHTHSQSQDHAISQENYNAHPASVDETTLNGGDHLTDSILRREDAYAPRQSQPRDPSHIKCQYPAPSNDRGSMNSNTEDVLDAIRDQQYPTAASSQPVNLSATLVGRTTHHHSASSQLLGSNPPAAPVGRTTHSPSTSSQPPPSVSSQPPPSAPSQPPPFTSSQPSGIVNIAMAPIGPATDGAELWQIQFYKPAVQDVLEHAKQFSHWDAASVNAFPLCSNFNTQAIEYVEEAISERKSHSLPISDSWWPQYMNEIGILLWEDLGNWCSVLRKKAHMYVTQHYKWDPENHCKVNSEIAKGLLGAQGVFLRNGVDDNIYKTMSSSNDGITIPKLSGPNYLSWAPQMKAYLRTKGLWVAIRTDRNDGTDDDDIKAAEKWDDANDQAMGHLLLRMEPAIANRYVPAISMGDIWKDQREAYAKPSIATVYMEFHSLLNTNIPKENHPAPSFAKINAHFACLKEYDYEIFDKVQAMIVLAKVPKYMDIVAHLLNIAQDAPPSAASSGSTTPAASKKTALTIADIECMAVLAYSQHMSKRKPQQHANKISAVKRKGIDPKFSQQQQQQAQQQGSGGDRKKKKRGNRSEAGQAKQDARKAVHTHTAAAANTSFTFSAFADMPVIDPAITTIPHPVVNPRAAHYGEPAFPQMKRSIALAHRLEVTPTIETICCLDPVANRDLSFSDRISAPAGEATIQMMDDGIDIEAFGFPPAGLSHSLMDCLDDTITSTTIVEIDKDDCISLGSHAEEMYFDYDYYLKGNMDEGEFDYDMEQLMVKLLYQEKALSLSTLEGTLCVYR